MVKKSDSKKRFGSNRALYYLLQVLIIALIVLIAYILILVGYRFGRMVFSNEPMSVYVGEKAVTFEVAEGESTVKVAEELENKDLVKDKLAFVLLCRFYDATIYPGTYELNTSMTAKDIIDILGNKKLENEGNESSSG